MTVNNRYLGIEREKNGRLNRLQRVIFRPISVKRHEKPRDLSFYSPEVTRGTTYSIFSKGIFGNIYRLVRKKNKGIPLSTPPIPYRNVACNIVTPPVENRWGIEKITLLNKRISNTHILLCR